MRLSSKLISAFVFVMLLLGAGVGICHHAVRSTTASFVDLMNTDVSIAVLANDARTALEQCRKNEKGFLLHLDTRYGDQLEESVAALKQSVDRIAALAKRLGDTATGEQAAQIISSVN